MDCAAAAACRRRHRCCSCTSSACESKHAAGGRGCFRLAARGCGLQYGRERRSGRGSQRAQLSRPQHRSRSVCASHLERWQRCILAPHRRNDTHHRAVATTDSPTDLRRRGCQQARAAGRDRRHNKGAHYAHNSSRPSHNGPARTRSQGNSEARRHRRSAAPSERAHPPACKRARRTDSNATPSIAQPSDESEIIRCSQTLPSSQIGCRGHRLNRPRLKNEIRHCFCSDAHCIASLLVNHRSLQLSSSLQLSPPLSFTMSAAGHKNVREISALQFKDGQRSHRTAPIVRKTCCG